MLISIVLGAVRLIELVAPALAARIWDAKSRLVTQKVPTNRRFKR